jgi:hypothetical protein
MKTARLFLALATLLAFAPLADGQGFAFADDKPAGGSDLEPLAGIVGVAVSLADDVRDHLARERWTGGSSRVPDCWGCVHRESSGAKPSA